MKKIRCLAAFLLLCLLLQPVFSCFAAEASPEDDGALESSASDTVETQTPADPEPSAPDTQGGSDDLQLPTGFELPPELIEYCFPAEDFDVRAKAAALIELNSHTIVYGEELDLRLYPASLTKIMTCMLALEYGDLNDTLTVSSTALENLSIYGSTAGLVEGEEISLRELLYCIMVSSANEGCNVVAEYISGSVEAFVDLMNRQAQTLGMTGTHYANTHGLHDEDHYTTVRDLAILATWAWQNPQFREFATTTAHTVPATNKSGERLLHTTNYLTSTDMENRYYYSLAQGIKTGFTTPAGGCLISTASSGDLAFLSIVCGCEMLIDNNGEDLDMRFVETKKLFEYGFETFTYVQVLSNTAMLGQPQVLNADGRENVVVHARDNVTVLLPKNYQPENITLSLHYDASQTLEAPLEKGQRVGTVTAMYNDIPLATSDLVTLTAVKREAALPVESIGGEETPSTEAGPTGFLRYWYLTVPLLLLSALFIILLIIRSVNVHKAKKYRKRRRQQAAHQRSGYDD
ncbi:MAG: D-alanyl-D-alanine carboxypeptidase family protein [Faecousia sp.]